MSMPQREPGKKDEVILESRDSVLIVLTGPGDTTIRPRPPNIPRCWPKDYPPPGQTPPAEPS
jgi:hypothetical protein